MTQTRSEHDPEDRHYGRGLADRFRYGTKIETEGRFTGTLVFSVVFRDLRRELRPDPREYMDQKKRCDPEQSYPVSKKPSRCGGPKLAPWDGFVRSQTSDTDCGSSRGHCHGDEHVPYDILTPSQP